MAAKASVGPHVKHMDVLQMYFDFRLDLGYQQLIAEPTPILNKHAGIVAADPFPFQSLKHATEMKLKRIHASRSSLREDWSEQASKNGKFALSAQQWTLSATGAKRENSHIATLRMVYIRGQKNEIINTWIFPVRPDFMPVYAAELISVASVTRVAFVDIQTPNLTESVTDEVKTLTAPLAARFAGLPCDEAAPDWAIEASTGNFTYARGADSNWTSTIQQCYVDYLDTYIKAFVTSGDSVSVRRDQRDNAISAHLSEYQRHHMNSSPGKKFLGTLFGTEWTDSFLSEFLFSTP